MKKEEMASKMKVKCTVCGRNHSKALHSKIGAPESGDTVEGDSAPHYKPEDRFSKGDVSKEKSRRAERNGKMSRSDWEN